ncbi:hypothetical protein [Komagataeibacter medellinensis]|uniref:hypothetical protein n=1 Tax=Komagataeibacter medellinensis TaxID=1177712 RepID=UPI00129588AD|nr:hypothetical protein [Komagataeibacter medellinensis]
MKKTVQTLAVLSQMTNERPAWDHRRMGMAVRAAVAMGSRYAVGPGSDDYG